MSFLYKVPEPEPVSAWLMNMAWATENFKIFYRLLAGVS